jgi:hypothetical protein
MDSMTTENQIPDVVTIDITDSNEIQIPEEWLSHLGLGFYGTRHVQITLVDDRIAIHKPTDIGVEYKSPCKVGDNSYIRSFLFYSVKIPPNLLKALDIKNGSSADLSLEENCVSIRKNTETKPMNIEPELPEPLMAFCCVCGHLLYTAENGLVKVMQKYICHECIDRIKQL